MKYSFYEYDGFCLCPVGGTLPQGARAAEAPFSPLVFLVSRPIERARGFFALNDMAELYEEETPALLLPYKAETTDALSAFVKARGAAAVNTDFKRWPRVLRDYRARQNRPLRLNLVGLGDVGGTVLTGLKLLGKNISEIGIFDPDEKRTARYELELNQVLALDYPLPRVTVCGEAALFDCDALLFTASRGVPGLDTKTGDVRLIQYAANRDMLKSYARAARESGFTGLFAQISDPVDQLSRAVFLQSNKSDTGLDGEGLLPEQIQGYGLGVMRARALYYAKKLGQDAQTLCAYGPHGAGLVIANAPDAGYDAAASERLTKKAAAANLEVRALGYKPYIAPGLSSACVSVLKTLSGEWHDGAAPLDGAYFGCTARFSKNGPEAYRRPLAPALYERVCAAHAALAAFNYGI